MFFVIFVVRFFVSYRRIDLHLLQFVTQFLRDFGGWPIVGDFGKIYDRQIVIVSPYLTEPGTVYRLCFMQFPAAY